MLDINSALVEPEHVQAILGIRGSRYGYRVMVRIKLAPNAIVKSFFGKYARDLRLRVNEIE